MGNEESREQPKPLATTNIQVTGYQQTPLNHNAQPPLAPLNAAGNNPTQGWVMPQASGNNNAHTAPSQNQVYPNLPPSYNTVHAEKQAEAQLPQQPSAPSMFYPQAPNAVKHAEAHLPQQPSAPSMFYPPAPTAAKQAEAQLPQQPSAPSIFYPQAPTNQFYAQPVVGSSITQAPSVVVPPAIVPPFNSHSIIPQISNDIWSRGNSIPPNSFRAGHDTDGTVLYICRAAHDGDLLPGKLVPTHKSAYICHNGREIPKNAFETLIGDQYRWVPANNGYIPAGAVEGGRTDRGEKLYIGRVSYERSLTPGKVHPSHGCLYIPYGGEEISFKNYEILVHSNHGKY